MERQFPNGTGSFGNIKIESIWLKSLLSYTFFQKHLRPVSIFM